MRSVIFSSHGGPEVLELVDQPTPLLGSENVLVKLYSAALNRMDLFVRNGWPGLNLDLPHIPGADGAGEIIEIGENVHNWDIGDRIVINSNLGCSECANCMKGQDNLC